MKKASLLAVSLLVLAVSLAFVGNLRVADANFKVPKEIMSPQSTTYAVSDVPLNVAIEALTLYHTIDLKFYSLDGKANAALPFPANETGTKDVPSPSYWGYKILSGLSKGAHNIQVYYKSTRSLFTIQSASTPSVTPSSPTSPSATPTPSNSTLSSYPEQSSPEDLQRATNNVELVLVVTLLVLAAVLLVLKGRKPLAPNP